MYDPIYNANHYTPGQYKETAAYVDFDSEADARKAVETAGAGYIVKFARYPNLPGCLPEIRCSSIWMEKYEDGQWKKCNIHG